MRRGAAALLLGIAAAAAAAGCAGDPWREPLPGSDVRVVLAAGPEPVKAPWPVSFRRAARFVLENGTGKPVETVIVDFMGKGQPRELAEAVIEEPAGLLVTIIPAPHGLFPLRARLGEPGSVLLAPGERLVLRVRVEGTPGACVAKFSVPL